MWTGRAGDHRGGGRWGGSRGDTLQRDIAAHRSALIGNRHRDIVGIYKLIGHISCGDRRSTMARDASCITPNQYQRLNGFCLPITGVAPYRRPYEWPVPSDVSSAIMTLPELSVLHSTHDYDNSPTDPQDAMAHLPLDGLETPMYMRTVSFDTEPHVWSIALDELEVYL